MGTAERPLLSSNTEIPAELLVGPKSGGKKPPLRFAPIEELDDSSEAEMDLSDGGGGGRQQQPSAPKWSNPDPYTVLPPPSSDTRGKKLDVVKLIRKARVETSSEKKPAERDAVASNEDFISFGDVDEAPVRTKIRDIYEAVNPRSYEGRSSKRRKRIQKYYTDGSIVGEWRKRPGESGTPWFDSTVESGLHLGTRYFSSLSPFLFLFFFFFFLNQYPAAGYTMRSLAFTIGLSHDTMSKLFEPIWYRGCSMHSEIGFTDPRYVHLAPTRVGCIFRPRTWTS